MKFQHPVELAVVVEVVRQLAISIPYAPRRGDWLDMIDGAPLFFLADILVAKIRFPA